MTNFLGFQVLLFYCRIQSACVRVWGRMGEPVHMLAKIWMRFGTQTNFFIGVWIPKEFWDVPICDAFFFFIPWGGTVLIEYFRHSRNKSVRLSDVGQCIWGWSFKNKCFRYVVIIFPQFSISSKCVKVNKCPSCNAQVPGYEYNPCSFSQNLVLNFSLKIVKIENKSIQWVKCKPYKKTTYSFRLHNDCSLLELLPGLQGSAWLSMLCGEVIND